MTVTKTRRQMAPTLRSKRRPLASLLLALGLAGCVAEAPSPPGSERFLVEPIRLTHRTTFASGESRLSEAEEYQLLTFLNEVDPDRKASIYLDAVGPDKDGRIDAVASALRDLDRESLGGGGGPGTEHGVTVTLLQDVVLPEACLNSDGWPQPHLPPASCTTALTLVEMVEDPNDLIRGREMGPALSATAARAATRHLKRRAPGTIDERPVNIDPEATPELPPAPVTQDASY